MKRITLLFLCATINLTITNVYAKEKKTKRKEEIIYKYKKVVTFDFSEMDIEGNAMFPGDLSVKFRKRKDFSKKFRIRKNFDDEIKKDLRELY